MANQFCLKAVLKNDSTILELQTTKCTIAIGTICRKLPYNSHRCNKTNVIEDMDFLTNPSLASELLVTTNFTEAVFREMYARLNKTSGFEALFSLLWYSSFPCNDVNGVTSLFDGGKSTLKSCYWKGIKISCAAIFKMFPSDQGMCCSFNMKAADEIFRQKTYSRLVMEAQDFDQQFSFLDYQVPEWYSSASEPQTQAGVNKGLMVVLDGHNDIITPGSVDTDYQGFTGIVTGRGSYPLTNQGGFRIMAGHFNFVGLSATKITPDDGIINIKPDKRNCLFPEENVGLKIHLKYSQSNCFLECSMFYAQNQMTKPDGDNKPCFPWYLPTSEEFGTICDPWQAAEFNIHFEKVPSNACNQCLPDCESTIYEPSLSTVPFRKCDVRNMGVSQLCQLDDITLPEPRIWARQALEGLSPYGTIDPVLQKSLKLMTSKRSYRSMILPPSVFNQPNETYEAYDKDIAVVQVYFKTSTIIEFETQPSQDWVGFFSTIGGLLGLCIGLSIVTLVELCWLGFRILTNTMGKKPYE